MTRLEVIGKALSGSISWLDAAVVLGVSARQMRRLRRRFECFGKEGLLDGRRGLSRRRRIPDATVSELLRALGIEHLRAMTPEARGRSERCFGTLQGRLPQELRLHGVSSYELANRYLEQTFIADFNRRFAVRPRERGSAFSALSGVDLELLVSAQHERIVQKDNTVVFGRLLLQLSPSPERMHYVRCPVLVHELVDDTLAASFHGKLIGRFDRQGTP